MPSFFRHGGAMADRCTVYYSRWLGPVRCHVFDISDRIEALHQRLADCVAIAYAMALE
jgi:hypothetical protein